MKGCIISYEPEDKVLFKKRIKPLKQNIENILNFCDEVYIIAQCWSQETIETYKQEKVKIIIFDKPLGVAEAKNYFLREYLYKSDDDYCYFSDDDSCFVDRYNIYELFDMLKNNDEEIRFIDILSPYPCNLQGYKEMNLEKRDLVEKNFTFICSGNILCTFFFKNFKKLYGKEFYFRDKIGNTPIHDDEDMIYRLLIEGFKRVQCEQFIANNSLNYSTIRNNSSDLLDIRKNTLENIIREYNLPLSTSYQKIKTKYLTYPKIIKRKTHYEFSDIEKTLKRRGNSISNIIDLVNKNNSFILGCENNKTLESFKK